MKKIIVIIGFFVIGLSFVFGGERVPMAAYQSADSLWHIIGDDGKEMMPALNVEEVSSYSDGLLVVQKPGKYYSKKGYMDLTGKMVIEPQFDKADPFVDGFAIVMDYTDDARNDMQSGLIDKKGQFFLPIENADLLPFAEGLVYVMNSKFRGYVDREGKLVIKLNEMSGYSFKEGLAAVVNQEMKFGYIDNKGNQVMENKYNDAGSFSEGLAYVYSGGNYGYMDKKWNMVIMPIFDFAKDYKEGKAAVGKHMPKAFKTDWGFIDKLGNNITGFKYEAVENFQEGLAAVQLNEKWGFIDYFGKVALEIKYSHCSSFVNGLAWASIKDEGKFGFINKKGEWVIQVPMGIKYVDLRLNKVVY
jgi:hypothetical protein